MLTERSRDGTLRNVSENCPTAKTRDACNEQRIKACVDIASIDNPDIPTKQYELKHAVGTKMMQRSFNSDQSEGSYCTGFERLLGPLDRSCQSTRRAEPYLQIQNNRY